MARRNYERGGEADRHFCQYTKKEGGRQQGGGVSLSRRCRYKDHSCHFAMTKLCPEFSVSLRSLGTFPRLVISRFRSLEFEGKLEFVSLSSSVAGLSGLCRYIRHSFRSSFPSSSFNRLIFLVILSRSLSLLIRPPTPFCFAHVPSLHRAITNCSTKVLRNKRYMRWRKGMRERSGGGEWRGMDDTE